MLLSNTEQIRECDRIQISELGTPGVLLMEHAGRSATEKILELYPGQEKFLVLAGPGNNGGDGLVIARLLHLAGRKVQVLLSHDPSRYAGDARINFSQIDKLPIPVAIFSEEKAREGLAFLPLGFPVPKESDYKTTQSPEGPLLIDALLGTGTRGALRKPIDSIVDFFRPLHFQTIAIDLPSGLDASTGTVSTKPLLADYTLSFHLPKVCHAVSPASRYCGQVEVLDIGIWPQVNPQLMIQREWTDVSWGSGHYRKRDSLSHKGDFGHVLIIGGSRPMTGAIALAAYAAVAGGAGLVTVLCPAACRQAVNALVPEAMVLTTGGDSLGEEDIPVLRAAAHNKDVVVIGPGMGKHPGTASFVAQAMGHINCDMVIDADALNILAAIPKLFSQLPKRTILTPHPGEMARLYQGDKNVMTQRLEVAESFAREKGCIVVLKGAGTVTALPEGKTYVNRSGNPGLGSGGTGDVLAGLTGALLGQGYGDLAAAYAVWLHGHSADILAEQSGEASVTASRLSDNLIWPIKK